MMRRLPVWLSMALWPVLALASGGDEAALKQQIVRESIAAHAGSCPCPYNTDKAGRSCGKRSAWNRPNGARPLCYPDDVTPEMVRQHTARRR